jgi:predicted glycoside hydrolase/deacetylase ChbG (UPF0249 family)
VNADDFGLTSGVNRAIAEASSSGIVTSATIMANSPRFEEAVEIAKTSGRLKTGCHIVLIDGQPLCEGLTTLTNGARRFRSSLKDFAGAAVRGKIREEEVQREAEAQICKLQSQGIEVTHVDSHKHTHMFPRILRPVLRAARACGVLAVRNPFEPWSSRPPGLVRSTPALWGRAAGVACFHLFARAFRRAIENEAMRTTGGTIGIAVTGMLDQKILSAMLERLPEGTWELVCHPGYSDTDLAAAGTRLTRSREVELAALTSEETRSLISRRGIELISYAELPAPTPKAAPPQ